MPSEGPGDGDAPERPGDGDAPERPGGGDASEPPSDRNAPEPPGEWNAPDAPRDRIGSGARTSRLRRWRGLAGVGFRRVAGRSTGRGGRRVLAGVVGTALAVALLVTVTGVGAGLAVDATVHGSEVDYWVVPEAGAGSPLVDTGGPQLGGVHEATDRVDHLDGVTYATPVRSEPVRLSTGDREEYVLLVGVLGDADGTRVAGAATDGLTADDPHFADGDYDGPWTGELVATEGAASLLDLEVGDEVEPAGANRSFTVATVDRESGGPAGGLPVAVVHLSELQVLSGDDEHDAADQLLVAAGDPGVRPELAALYDGATVETRSSLLAGGTVDEGLPLALALGALVVALVVGVLFVTVTIGLEVLDQGPELAAMQAVGLGRRSRLAIVGVQAVATAALGGLLGVVLGPLVLVAVEAGGARFVGIDAPALFHPLLVPYGLAAALVVGLLALPPVLWLVERAPGTVEVG